MEDFELTLYDYRDELQWVRVMGWTDEELQSVPVHEQASSEHDYINLANFGGTPLGVSAESGGGTSAGVRNIRNLYVYKDETPTELWNRLWDLLSRGGPSAYERNGVFGEVGEVEDFPPKT